MIFNTERVFLLRQELQLEALPIPIDGPVGQALLEELAYTINPPVHEQRVPAYGAFIFPEVAIADDILHVSELPSMNVRMLADGAYSFSVRDETGLSQIACFTNPLTSEIDFVTASQRGNMQIVQRNSGDLVKIFTGTHVITHQRYRWYTKQYATVDTDKILDVAPQAGPLQLLPDLLNFCFHFLSANHVGAILVWQLDDTPTALLHGIESGIHIADGSLSLRKQAHRGAIMSLLAQMDGAAVIAPDGDLVEMGAFLRSSDQAQRLVSRWRGTRHTAAKRFSYDEPRSIVFVVSADGPVTVFSDGVNVIELKMFTPHHAAALVQQMLPDRDTAQDVDVVYHDIVCPRCGKMVRAEVIAVPGWADPAEGRCPCCGTIVLRQSSWRIRTKIVKRW